MVITMLTVRYHPSMGAFASISLVVGTLFAAGAALALRAHVSTRNAVRVRAKIVGKTVKRLSLERRSQRIPVTRFEVEVPSAASGPLRIWLSEGIGDSYVETLVGGSDTLPVFHPAGHPERARIDSGWTRYMVPAYLCAPGVLWALLLVYVAFAY
jgi:hypothetical protein